jgi:hypothetical protein
MMVWKISSDFRLEVSLKITEFVSLGNRLFRIGSVIRPTGSWVMNVNGPSGTPKNV